MVQCLLFFSGWTTRYWVWLTSIVLLLFQHTFLPISMWMLIICPGVSCFQSGTFFLRWLKWLLTFAAYQRWICWHPPHTTQFQHYYTLKILLPLGALGLNAFNDPSVLQVSYAFYPPALVPLVLSKFLTEHVKGQLRLLILVAPCWMEAPWLPTVLSILADVPRHCPIIKILLWMFQYAMCS